MSVSAVGPPARCERSVSRGLPGGPGVAVVIRLAGGRRRIKGLRRRFQNRWKRCIRFGVTLCGAVRLELHRGELIGAEFAEGVPWAPRDCMVARSRIRTSSDD